MKLKRVQNNRLSPKSIQDTSSNHSIDSDSDTVSQLIELLRSVDLNDRDAKLNATTISDGRGGRILL